MSVLPNGLAEAFIEQFSGSFSDIDIFRSRSNLYQKILKKIGTGGSEEDYGLL